MRGDDFGYAGDIAGDDGHSHGHRFQKYGGQPIGVAVRSYNAGRRKNVRPAQERCDL
ncbi:hypothetical protein GCM10009611_15040 [Arthrobacter roseus]